MVFVFIDIGKDTIIILNITFCMVKKLQFRAVNSTSIHYGCAVFIHVITGIFGSYIGIGICFLFR